MASFHDFEELDVWKESRILARSIRLICKRSIVRHDFTFIDQITKATRSISANIAEGSDSMTHGDFIRFLSYAKRSATEVRAHLYDALDEAYISQEEFKTMANTTKKICSMLAKLMHYLQSLDNSLKRTYKKTNKPINE